MRSMLMTPEAANEAGAALFSHPQCMDCLCNAGIAAGMAGAAGCPLIEQALQGLWPEEWGERDEDQGDCARTCSAFVPAW